MLAGMHWKKVDLVNLRDKPLPPLSGYDTVIIGGSVHMGRIQEKIRKFCSDNEADLLRKRLGLYLCHMCEGEKAASQFKGAFSEKLRDHAMAKGLFGGEFTLEKMNRAERELISSTGVEKSVSHLDKKAIEGFGRVMFHLDKS